ncbi:quinoprotein dehydrogenase-associated putative ABC transporter substrate-binding protein [Antarcticirhabdus aurantiaca]|uniref:Quinoprotein dehydrogenase-associated putative ABC transporter substrate-binding protein n=1 Tax=Antarcticirhabdus aurantiaca TaxID=2606717 RepID=A0ACD4NKE2_9HYPH|nr:quinoprotein dehydrogenase-associated putative ABC transporter substrate-binding protein [Antarcticirhabdus aurantiaca]WAJ27284.1 quinoprotein dehydrogenase-associated putative ABC transporter substrate-binding protein [Jeongeuplla avenae]
MRAGPYTRFSAAAGALALAAALAVPAAAQDREFGSEIELVDQNVLRVCADPDNMPFSNEKEEGFEQAVAKLLAEKLGRARVAYTYFPQATGFVRMTLGAYDCDVIMSYPQGDELVQNTNAYYTTAYVLIVPADGDLAGVTSLDDERLKGKRVGVVAGTPAATYLAKAGLIGRAKPYQLMVDTRLTNVGEDMIADMMKGETDAAVMWGPIGGYYARKAGGNFQIAPIAKQPTLPATVFRITMGVRASDQEWKRTLNRFIAANEPELQRILASYGVPLFDDAGRPIANSSAAPADVETGVAGPADEPVTPATGQGGG